MHPETYASRRVVLDTDPSPGMLYLYKATLSRTARIDYAGHYRVTHRHTRAAPPKYPL